MTAFAWLIEAKGEHGPVYWDGRDWSSNYMRAVRFARSVDAERIMINLPVEYRWPGMGPVEHGWDNASATADSPSSGVKIKSRELESPEG